MLNIYCDESCHLELSGKKPNEQQSMVIGGISCSADFVKDINEQIREIKKKHNIQPFNEIKWTKVSKNKVDFYHELIEYFFNNKNLSFRCVVFPDKAKFNYDKYDHDDLYDIMYYYMLREMIDPSQTNCIYVDKKDTRGSRKIKNLKEYLCLQKLDFDFNLIKRIQIVDSRDIELVQLTDLLVGAVSYANRELDKTCGSEAKKQLVELIRLKTGYNLQRTTLRREEKFNIFIWKSANEL